MFGAAVGTAALLLAACSGSGTGSAVPAPAAPVSSTTTAAPTGSGATGPAPGPTTPAPAGSGPSTTGATGKAAPPSYGQGPTASTKPTPGPGPSTASTLPPAVPARPGTITSPGIWVAGVDGSAPTRLPVEPEAGTGGGPAWSLDGHQIAYVGADHGLWVVGADGSGAHRIAAGPVEADVAEGAAAAWAADGTLLYATWDGHHSTVHAVSSDGSGDMVLSPANFPRVVAIAYSSQTDVLFSDGSKVWRGFAGSCDDFGRDASVCTSRTGTVYAQVPVAEGALSTSDDGDSQIAAGSGTISFFDDSGDPPRTVPAGGPVDSLAWLDHFAGYAWSAGGTVSVARNSPDDPRPAPPLVVLAHAAEPAWMGGGGPGGANGSVLFVDGGPDGSAVGIAGGDGTGRRVILSAPAGLRVHLAASAVSPGGRLVLFSALAR